MNIDSVQEFHAPMSSDPLLYFRFPWQGLEVGLSHRDAGDLGPSGAAGRAKRSAFSARLRSPFPGEVAISEQSHSFNVFCILGGEWGRMLGTFEGASLSVAWEPGGKFETSPGVADVTSLVHVQKADGVITDIPGVVFGQTVADCMPIYLRGEGTSTIGAILHSGWAGTGILGTALAALDRFGLLQGCDLKVFLGPAIAARHYAVPEERAALFRSRFGPASTVRLEDGQPALDMFAANLSILSQECPATARLGGLGRPRSVNVDHTTVSTFDTPTLHSFRRDGESGFGRMLAFFRMLEA